MKRIMALFGLVEQPQPETAHNWYKAIRALLLLPILVISLLLGEKVFELLFPLQQNNRNLKLLVISPFFYGALIIFEWGVKLTNRKLYRFLYPSNSKSTNRK